MKIDFSLWYNELDQEARYLSDLIRVRNIDSATSKDLIGIRIPNTINMLYKNRVENAITELDSEVNRILGPTKYVVLQQFPIFIVRVLVPKQPRKTNTKEQPNQI